MEDHDAIMASLGSKELTCMYVYLGTRFLPICSPAIYVQRKIYHLQYLHNKINQFLSSALYNDNFCVEGS